MKNLNIRVGRIKTSPMVLETESAILAFYKVFYPYKIDTLLDGCQEYWCYSDYFREIFDGEQIPEYDIEFFNNGGTILITKITEI